VQVICQEPMVCWAQSVLVPGRMLKQAALFLKSREWPSNFETYYPH